MGVSLYRTVKMGDMQALYFLEETERHMSLMLLPEGMEPVPWENKKQAADSLVQAYMRGDDLPLLPLLEIFGSHGSGGKLDGVF